MLLGGGKMSGYKWFTGIEPTNDTAERALRPVVIQRKLSFGNSDLTRRPYFTGNQSQAKFLEIPLI